MPSLASVGDPCSFVPTGRLHQVASSAGSLLEGPSEARVLSTEGLHEPTPWQCTHPMWGRMRHKPSPQGTQENSFRRPQALSESPVRPAPGPPGGSRYLKGRVTRLASSPTQIERQGEATRMEDQQNPEGP